MVLCLAAIFPVSAQPSISATLGGSFDSYSASSGSNESRRNVAGTLNIDNLFAAGRGRVFYGLDAGNYDSPGDWSFQVHEAGLSYRLAGTDTSRRTFTLSGALSTRRNGDAWTGADYTAGGVGARVELHPREGTTLRSGYHADARRFGDLSALTQLEQRVFASLTSSFQTRTTLVMESQIGTKRYDGLAYAEATSATVVDVSVSPSRGRGYGAAMGPSVRYTTVFPSLASSQQGSAGLVSVMGRIAQSLTDRTGVRVQATARKTFGSVPPLLVTTPAGFFEDGVYDDPFASNGLFVEAGITHVFASAAEVAATGWWATKDYTSATALDATGVPVSGSPLRSDRVSMGSLSWTQPLFAAKTGALALSAEVGYRLIRHSSGDAYYNYTSHAVSAGLSIGY